MPIVKNLVIAAKTLGELAMPEFCPRCFWIKLHAGKLPFQIFPGIFSSIDSYTKNIVNGYFDSNRRFPAWLGVLGELEGYQEPLHYSKFRVRDSASGVTLQGTPDAIYKKTDGSYIIADYKTARYTGNQDKLMPIYEIQLNVYAAIGERTKLVKPVSDLALIYMEPVTGKEAIAELSNHRGNGFAMGFSANIHRVDLNPDIIPPLLYKAREIYEMESPPDGLLGCKECSNLENLMRVTLM